MSFLPRSLVPTLIACSLLLALPAAAEMYQYVDSQGQLHFTQDITQVPPEYRNQVERRVLKKEISVTGDPVAKGANESTNQRKFEMTKRKHELEKAASKRTSRANPMTPLQPPPVKNPLEGAPEPIKYTQDCSYNPDANRHCRRNLTLEWIRWNDANGGDNGKPVIRRKVGEKD